MHKIPPEDAKRIHEKIMQSHADGALLTRYEKELINVADLRHIALRNGDNAQQFAQVKGEVRQTLESMGIDRLQECQLVARLPHQVFINLHTLAEALPTEVVDSYFEHNPVKKAQELGITLDEFNAELKTAFRGTSGVAGKNGFGIWLEKSFAQKYKAYFRSIGLQEIPRAKEGKVLISAYQCPMVVAVVAQATNFNGAANYLPTGLDR